MREHESMRPREATVEFNLPNPYGGTPWVTARLAWHDEALARGEVLRVRAHVDGCLHMPPAGQDALGVDGDGRHARARRWFADALQEAVQRLPEQHRTALTQWRHQGWVDVRMSSAPLDQGAEALVPDALRAWWRTHEPDRDAQAMGSRAGVWSGAGDAARSSRAALAWLQLDERGGRTGAMIGRLIGMHVHACAARLAAPDANARHDAHTRHN